MPDTLQEFLAAATSKAHAELVTAFLRLPEDKRVWSPGGTARTALDQVAECAVLNGYTADLIRTRQWSISGFDDYQQEKTTAIAAGWDAIQARLEDATQRVVDVIRAVPDGAFGGPISMPYRALGDPIPTPWGSQPLAEILAYPYWNMSYHQGQINYIASILGCLD